ncbi:uroporphyrinogen decarboxylase [Caldicoprobacter guelmensis]|uniref:uroporphyrinogen decarboxylase family protein n=1 Tax=Caldicoprobacter guelmensis TaxID=1170224 RepID=UPI00195D555D|nr:uroporphyrinogen decarboxylase family protein [Caldicoprobacter guelmensis]MBM7582141.1 uroporphyrinogen decarboxylase [Caldicoprobacter guelmensis]
MTSTQDSLEHIKIVIEAFKNAGYDYVTIQGSDFHFPHGEVRTLKTRSLNEGGVIKNHKDFENYKWPDPDLFDYSRLEKLKSYLPDGMKFIVYGPCGVLENVIQLVGYDSLCYMIYEDPDLVQDIFDAVGSRLVRYYEICAAYDTVGALISNDDWGFKTQTMLSPEHMRKYVFPWHKKIVETIHKFGKPAILHSCGNLEEVMEDVIVDMGYDAKHSFEDAIMPVEEAYDRWGGRIAILGGIDVDFVCRASIDEIKQRCRAMLEKTKDRGGYALGTGNSVPEYVPQEKYFAMISVALEG